MSENLETCGTDAMARMRSGESGCVRPDAGETWMTPLEALALIDRLGLAEVVVDRHGSGLVSVRRAG